jgi:uncharacterized protein
MHRSFKNSGGNTSTRFAIGIALSLGLVGCQPSTPDDSIQAALPASTRLTQTLVVSGQGSVDIPRSIAKVSLGVQVQDTTSATVQQQIAKRSDAVVKLLKSNQSIKKLETTSVTLSPDYRTKDGKSEIDGYTGTMTVQFEIPPDKLGSLLDDAIKAGATRVEGLSLAATDTAIAEAQQRAIAAASQDAQAQAQAALSALGLKSQRIVSIQINRAQPPMPMADSALNQLAAPAAVKQLPVVAGQQRIEAAVTLQVRYQ